MVFISGFICVFGLLINISTGFAVDLKITIEGVPGGSVLLPCVTNKREQKPQDINVTWKYKNKLNVHEIIQGKSLAEDQDQKFKNRTETFPEEFVKGNFSLRLNNLTNSDGGEYHCFIKHSGEAVTIEQFIIVQHITVEGVIGGSVLLPCGSNKPEHIQGINVRWSYNRSLNVCAPNITEGKCSVELQEQKFKNRIEFVKGNGSIKLNNLKHSDAGEYQCYNITSSEVVIVELRIGGNQTKLTKWQIFLIVLCCLVLIIIIVTAIIWKKIYKPCCSGGSAPGGYTRPSRVFSVDHQPHLNQNNEDQSDLSWV